MATMPLQATPDRALGFVATRLFTEGLFVRI